RWLTQAKAVSVSRRVPGDPLGSGGSCATDLPAYQRELLGPQTFNLGSSGHFGLVKGLTCSEAASAPGGRSPGSPLFPVVSRRIWHASGMRWSTRARLSVDRDLVDDLAERDGHDDVRGLDGPPLVAVVGPPDMRDE